MRYEEIVMFVAAFIMIVLLFAAACPEIRMVDSVVYSVSDSENVVVFETNDGNLWEAEVVFASRYEVGDSYRLFLSNNNTVSIYDDILVFMVKEG